jgi:hypothetical protein
LQFGFDYRAAKGVPATGHNFREADAVVVPNPNVP